MLLRSITKHVRDQNWFAVALDFVIVVAGILLAFQITNWNEQRQNRAAESEYLVALERDIKLSLEEIAEVTALSQKQEQARQTLYEYSLDDALELDPLELPKLIEAALWSFPSVELRQTTFDTLSSSGQLGILADKQMVVALQELAALIEEAETEKQHELYALERFGDPILYEHMDMAKVLRTQGLVVTGRVPWIKKTSPLNTIPEFFKTQKFRNALLFRSALTTERVGTYERLRLKYLEIGERIDARQNRSGDG